jgi:hypothetical protein
VLPLSVSSTHHGIGAWHASGLRSFLNIYRRCSGIAGARGRPGESFVAVVALGDTHDDTRAWLYPLTRIFRRSRLVTVRLYPLRYRDIATMLYSSDLLVRASVRARWRQALGALAPRAYLRLSAASALALRSLGVPLYRYILPPWCSRPAARPSTRKSSCLPRLMEAALRFSSWRRTGLVRIRIDGETHRGAATFASSCTGGLAIFHQRLVSLLAVFPHLWQCR